MRFLKAKKTDFVIQSTYNAFFLSAVLAKLSGTLCKMLDSVLAGRYLGTEQLAALSFLTPLFIVRSALVYLMMGGARFLCAYYIGSNEKKKANNVFTISLIVTAVGGLLLTLLYTPGAPFIVSLFGAKKGTALYGHAIEYLQSYGLGMLPFLMSYTLASFITINGSKDLVVWGTLAFGASDVVFDLLAVTVFKNGLYGIGLATSLSYLIETLILSLHFLRPRNSYRLIRPFSFPGEMWTCVHRGIIPCSNRLVIAAGTALENMIFYKVGGTAALAAMGVLNSITELVYIFLLSGNACMCNMVTMFIGEKDKKSMGRTFAAALRMETISLAVCFVVIVCFAPQLCCLFGVKEGVTPEYGIFALHCLAAHMFGSMLYKLFAAAQESLGRTLFSVAYDLVNKFVITIPLVFIFSVVRGTKGAFAALAAAELSIALICVAVVQGKQKDPKNPESWFLPDKNWHDAGRELTFFMDRNERHYAHAVRKIAEFCENNGLDGKTSNSIMLCTEEISALILDGDRAKRAYENIDFRCLLEDEAVYIRLRFTGKPYNPLADPKLAQSTGMKIIQGMTESRSYSYNMDMNVVILKYRVNRNKTEVC